MAAVPKFGGILSSEDEDDTHVGILHSTAIGDLSDSDVLAHDVSMNEDQVCLLLLSDEGSCTGIGLICASHRV